ncbi:BQ5605_C004g03099 [Microbotryum silenes-dioicae]|uniref:BQ5605_C004g03099 protein n=1 Tax=Microbotryum silenes-dioicae TaxID=796604 RepID=A0A2X0MD24_9BASI|nr:BQ5605_C004g03099 [Microbotryum silenes-dioicae]
MTLCFPKQTETTCLACLPHRIVVPSTIQFLPLPNSHLQAFTSRLLYNNLHGEQQGIRDVGSCSHVRHATTKKHLDAYNSRADPAVNWTNRLLQPTPQALSSSDEADLVDFNQNPAEAGTVGHSLLAVAGEIIKSSESVPASRPSPPSDHEDSVLDHALFLPKGNCSPYSQGTGSKSDSEVEIDGGAEEEESDDWAPPRCGRNYTSAPDSSHPWYPFPSQNLMIIVVFFRSHKRRVGVQELDDMLAFAKAFGVQGPPAASSVKKFLANLEKEIPLFKPRQYTKEDLRTLPTRGVASRLHRCARRRIKDALEWMKRVEKKCVVDEFTSARLKKHF